MSETSWSEFESLPPETRERETWNILKKINEKLDRIEEQTTKTNGNVKKLQLWKAYLTGAWAVLTVLVLPIAFIVFSKYI